MRVKLSAVLRRLKRFSTYCARALVRGLHKTSIFVGKTVVAVTIILHRFAARTARKLHFHIAHRPHQHLVNRWQWYDQWYQWDYHKHAHALTAAAFTLIMLSLVVSSYRTTFAADLTLTWDFSDSSDFTFENSAIETNVTSARLKAQNYSTDETTAALLHLDEDRKSVV